MKKISLFLMFVLFLEGVFGESVPVLVIEGDSVTLKTDLTEIKIEDVLDWRFGAGGDLIARFNKAAGKITYDDVPGGNFKGRLKLDDQTGSLTITNSRTTDSGEYKVTTTFTSITKTFSVTVIAAPDSGLSQGAIAGIVVMALLITAAAAGGAFYCYRKKKTRVIHLTRPSLIAL